MDKIQWFGSTNETCRGFVLPHFRIYRVKGNLVLFIFDDRPQSIPIESVRQGKIKAKKYLDNKIYDVFGD